MDRAAELATLLFDRLQQIEPLPATERERLRPLLHHRRVATGAYHVRGGQADGSIGYVCTGLLRYFYVDAEGREFTRYFCTSGNFVSAAASSPGSA